MAQEQAQSTAQGGQMAQMVMELMNQGATEEQAIQMIQQQMQGGQQGAPQQPQMPPEGMPQ